MQFIKLFTVIITITLFIAGCNSTQTDDTATTTNYPNDSPEVVNDADDDYYARENLDLQAVGEIFKESDSAEDFERRLNSDDGINNLDLNGDGYVDYISVNEYDDRDTGYRGFSLLDSFGGNAIQEIATIILDRTLNNGRDSRLYINGNDQIYGDDNYYQADWQDTTLEIVSWAFNDRDDTYRSPYYYDNYPDYYNTYRVIETPVYRNRIDERYSAPIFIKADKNDFENIKIESPYKGKSYDKIFAKLAKPNDEQKEFRKNNPKRPEFREKVEINKESRKEDKADKRDNGRDDSFEKPEKGKKNDFEKSGKDNKPEKNDKDRGQDFDKGKKDKGDKGGDKDKGNKGGGKGGGKGKN